MNHPEQSVQRAKSFDTQGKDGTLSQEARQHWQQQPQTTDEYEENASHVVPCRWLQREKWERVYRSQPMTGMNSSGSTDRRSK
jgi:hypothetical protein